MKKHALFTLSLVALFATPTLSAMEIEPTQEIVTPERYKTTFDVQVQEEELSIFDEENSIPFSQIDNGKDTLSDETYAAIYYLALLNHRYNADTYHSYGATNSTMRFEMFTEKRIYFCKSSLSEFPRNISISPSGEKLSQISGQMKKTQLSPVTRLVITAIRHLTPETTNKMRMLFTYSHIASVIYAKSHPLRLKHEPSITEDYI